MAKPKKKAVLTGKKSTGPVVASKGTGPKAASGKKSQGPSVPSTGTGPRSGAPAPKAPSRPITGKKTSRKGK